MAETISAIAGIVQFIDVAVRLSSGLSRLCSDIRDVPQLFHQLRIDLVQQLQVAQEIRTHHLPTFASTVASSTFDSPLLDYIALAEQLHRTLDELLAISAGRPFLRSWHNLRSVRKKENILRLCDHLEQKKNTLSLWLSAANL